MIVKLKDTAISPFGISSSRQACSFPSRPRIVSSRLCVDICSGLVDEVVWSCDPGEQKEAHGPLGWCRDLVILFQEYRPSSYFRTRKRLALLTTSSFLPGLLSQRATNCWSFRNLWFYYDGGWKPSTGRCVSKMTSF